MVKFIRELKESELAMRVKEKFFITLTNTPATKLHLKEAMERYRNCDNKKNASQIKKEIQICKKYWKCYPYHYFMHDLYKQENQLTAEELINYVPHFFYNFLFLPYYASSKFSMIANNKIITNHFFGALKINQPKTLCILFDGKLYTHDMNSCSFEYVIKELNDNNYEKIFVKPADGAGGKGIYIFHKTEHGDYKTRQNTTFNNEFLVTIGKKDNYIIQPGIVQDPELSRIFPGSVNTCRILTENKDGKVRIVSAMLRIGRGQNDIDNASSGGICTNVNIRTGKFGNFAISYSGEKFTRTPDTQFEFLNQGISRWNEIEKFTIDSAEKLPFFIYLGWDIALTRENPLAVEINSSPAIDIIEKTSSGLREPLGIDNPAYFWKNHGKRYKHCVD